MAQLPTAESFGERPLPTPSPAITQVQAGGTEAALAGMAETISNIEGHLQRARRASDLTDALGRATEALGTKAVEYSRDQDFRTAPARFKDDANTIGEQFANGLQDRVVRDIFTNEYRKLAVSKQLGVLTAAAKQEGDYNTGQLHSELDTYAKQYASSANDMERNSLLDLAKIAIGERVTAGWITDVQGQDLSKRFASRADQAVALQLINDNPVEAYKRFSTDSGYLPNLDPVKREELQRTAEVRMQQVDAQARKDKIVQDEQAREDLFQQYAVGKLSATAVARSPATTAVKEHYLALLKAQAKGEDATDRAGVKQDMWARIYLPYGDKNKITSLDPIREAATRGDLSERTYNFLRNEFVNSQTDDGQKIGPDLVRAARAGHEIMQKSLAGQMDYSGLVGDAAQRFERDLMDNVAKYRKENKDPRLLITPGSPDYMLTIPRVMSYMESGKQALSDAAKSAVVASAQKKPDGSLDVAAILQDANTALKKGTPKASVEARLKLLGIDAGMLTGKGPAVAVPSPASPAQIADPNSGLPM